MIKFMRCFFLILVLISNQSITKAQDKLQHKKYYFSTQGNDMNDGSLASPFCSVDMAKHLHLQAGDCIFLKGGDTFKGTLSIDSSMTGTPGNPVIISSYGEGKATINSGNVAAITVYNAVYLSISNLKLEGSGRKNGNTKEGLSIIYSNFITVDDIDVSGFQKAGLWVYVSSHIVISRVYAHDNGAAGIQVSGAYGTKNAKDIKIVDCLAENNPGDPTNLDNHSGNGILAGYCTNVMVEHCTATNNGWDMPRIGNGPVGIWCFEADSVTIQHCLSFRNKTSVGGADGGGFDLDGGTTNSLIQYCYSYENQGSGYGIFQYWGASDWHDNTVRYCISLDDGAVSDAHAGVHIWNSSDDKKQFCNFLFYNNTIYNSIGSAISYSEKSERAGFKFYNNILVAKDSLIKGLEKDDIFLGNDWWSLSKIFNVRHDYDFRDWAKKNGKEMINGKITGLNLDPAFPGLTSEKPLMARQLKKLKTFMIHSASPLQKKGLDLLKVYRIKTGNLDFNGLLAPSNGIGAAFRH
jgi:hypothetical protein